MGQYNISRNIEASIIDHLTSELASSWSDVNVEKSFARVYDLSLPTVCVQVSDTTHDKVQLGDDATWRTILVTIDIFATSDGNRLDLKDFIVTSVKRGFVYYEYTIVNGSVQSKTANGRIRTLNIDDSPINFNTDKNTLDVHDRYRHLITLNLSLGRVES